MTPVETSVPRSHGSATPDPGGALAQGKGGTVVAKARSTSAASTVSTTKAKASGAKKVAAAATGPHSSDGAIGAAVRDEALRPSWGQAGDRLTTAQGVRVEDTDNTLRAGSRGPALLEDFHFREKIMHFDHERIPERAVHARGAAAHGEFVLYESMSDVTCASFLCHTAAPTPVFLRFSTVVGSRGSADTARDVRGFSTRFYTAEGNFDLVGNNIPIFFIQDAIKFPDLVHAAKPEPDREIPQAQTAHSTFWDFVSLQPESTHMLMWAMSDRAIPRSYRTMEGFGIHTFRLVNEAGETTLVKFHWKPAAGIHGLVWEEAQKLGGVDPDFHRRDLAEAIEAGAFPEWELGLQLLPDRDDQFFEGIDLLDPTKIVPEELAPVQLVGKLTLNRNPSNFFAETEQVAFHPGHLVRGIDLTDDPLLQGRLFSYLDTQITRLGGPNFSQLPINRPHAPVNDNHRDGFAQQAIHEGRAPYVPNSIGGGCPFAAIVAGEVAPETDGTYVHVPRTVEGLKVRKRPSSFDDHYSQATLFWNSLSEVERDHVVGAFSFELSKVAEPVIVERMVAHLANVDPVLCGRVAGNLGLAVPKGSPATDVGVSRALSMIPSVPGPITGRVVALLAAPGVDERALGLIQKALDGAGAMGFVVAPHGGTLDGSIEVHKTVWNCESVEFDAVVVCSAVITTGPKVQLFLLEAYRHCKTIAAWGDAVAALADLGIVDGAPGVLVTKAPTKGFGNALCEAIGWHRHWDRQPISPTNPGRETP
jgi:catalase